MAHREFLIWLKPKLEGARTTGLGPDDVRAMRDELERMRKEGPLQPFASRLFHLVREHPTLEAEIVARLTSEIRVELAPPRERTVVLSANSSDEDE
jgi:hypothetical protein